MNNIKMMSAIWFAAVMLTRVSGTHCQRTGNSANDRRPCCGAGTGFDTRFGRR